MSECQRCRRSIAACRSAYPPLLSPAWMEPDEATCSTGAGLTGFAPKCEAWRQCCVWRRINDESAAYRRKKPKERTFWCDYRGPELHALSSGRTGQTQMMCLHAVCLIWSNSRFIQKHDDASNPRRKVDISALSLSSTEARLIDKYGIVLLSIGSHISV